MTGAIRYTCRTPQCPNWISFHSDTFTPATWICPACAAEDEYQIELAAKLVRLAEDTKRANEGTR